MPNQFSIPSGVRRCVDKHTKLIDEAIRLIENYRMSKFDRMQVRRALDADNTRQLELAHEINQKMLGPGYKAKAIKFHFNMLRELRELGIQNYALYHQMMEEPVLRMHQTLLTKSMEFVQQIMLDEDLDNLGSWKDS